jgi:hypothetical protein
MVLLDKFLDWLFDAQKKIGISYFNNAKGRQFGVIKFDFPNAINTIIHEVLTLVIPYTVKPTQVNITFNVPVFPANIDSVLLYEANDISVFIAEIKGSFVDNTEFLAYLNTIFINDNNQYRFVIDDNNINYTFKPVIVNNSDAVTITYSVIELGDYQLTHQVYNEGEVTSLVNFSLKTKQIK